MYGFYKENYDRLISEVTKEKSVFPYDVKKVEKIYKHINYIVKKANDFKLIETDEEEHMFFICL